MPRRISQAPKTKTSNIPIAQAASKSGEPDANCGGIVHLPKAGIIA
jgi:hypothetical protein